jgi:hypothetical protein
MNTRTPPNRDPIVEALHAWAEQPHAAPAGDLHASVRRRMTARTTARPHVAALGLSIACLGTSLLLMAWALAPSNAPVAVKAPAPTTAAGPDSTQDATEMARVSPTLEAPKSKASHSDATREDATRGVERPLATRLAESELSKQASEIEDLEWRLLRLQWQVQEQLARFDRRSAKHQVLAKWLRENPVDSTPNPD